MRDLARRHGIRPSKSLGQNFVVDPNTVARMVRLAEVKEGDRVIEVGAGVGSLTVGLAAVAERVVAVEFDRSLVPALEEATATFSNVEVVVGDAMSLDYGSIIGDRVHRFVSNLPYNIATPLIADLLEGVPLIEDFVVMVQREAGGRLVASPGSKVYGGVSVLVAYYAEAKVLGRVPRTVFWPSPKVESVIVHLVRRSPPVEVEYGDLMRVVRGAFAQRRKSVRNSLASALGVGKGEVEEALATAGIEPSSRAESLSIEEFARIAEALS